MADSLPAYKEWQIPPQAVAEDRRIGWLNDACDEGNAWIRSQRGFADFNKALDVFAGRDVGPVTPASYRSRVNPNRLKRNAREVTGALARLRPMWGYHSDNKAYKPQAEMMNKVTRAVYLEQFFDLSIHDALDYAGATCRGWVRPIYRRNMAGTGQGNIRLLTYGSPCVLPVQLPNDGNFQEAYAVTILDEMPVYMAHGMFPLFQHRLRASSSRYWYSNDNVRKSAQGNWLSRAFGKVRSNKGDAAAMSDLLVPMRYTYVIDLTINTTKSEIPMGQQGTSWFYRVPHIGQEIFVGLDPKSGTRITRKADENDARLYPYRRLLISSDTCIVYDGPSFDWHGMFPGVSFSVDSYPWEPLGFSLVHDGYEINEAIKEIYRGNMDKARAQVNPSLAYDQNAVTLKEARAVDPFQPNFRAGYDGTAIEGAPFQPIVPPEMLKIEAESMALAEKFESILDHQLGIADLATLAKMRAVGSMDELNKVVEANGPIIESLSRSMEPPMRDLGVMIKYLIMQHLTTSRIMQYVGEDGVSREVFDYDPATVVPSHLPGEDPQSPSAQTQLQRARIFADNLRFFILPNSLHEMSQMVMKLGLIQLRKAGVGIDDQTIAEAWSIPNYGSIDGNTVRERWQHQQEEQLEFAARMQEIGAAAGLGAPPGAAGPGKPTPEGRPPSGSAPPSLKSKDGGTRSTIAESK